MKISDFFTNVLGANLRNKRWSWGAVDPVTNRVFLRVWEDGIDTQKQRIGILDIEDRQRYPSPGFSERREQLDLIQRGYDSFGVVCKAVNPNAEKREIKSFDQTTLLRFGSLVKEGKRLYLEIERDIPVSDVERPRTAEGTLSNDLKYLIRQNKDTTTKEDLINARLGQGIFRKQVLKFWSNRCAVTNSETLDAIRASHIKPWRSSTNEERLDPNNGIPLIASLDALFDAGLISFDESGKLLVSSMLKDMERQIFGVNDTSLIRRPTKKTAEYLTYHRTHVFRN